MMNNFIEYFFRTCKKKGKDYVSVYGPKGVDVTRQYFSKILKKYHKDDAYLIPRDLAIAFGAILQLTLDELKDFLSHAGYTFPNKERDMIIVECFKRRYSLHEINTTLRHNHHTPLQSRTNHGYGEGEK